MLKLAIQRAHEAVSYATKPPEIGPATGPARTKRTTRRARR